MRISLMLLLSVLAVTLLTGCYGEPYISNTAPRNSANASLSTPRPAGAPAASPAPAPAPAQRGQAIAPAPAPAPVGPSIPASGAATYQPRPGYTGRNSTTQQLPPGYGYINEAEVLGRIP